MLKQMVLFVGFGLSACSYFGKSPSSNRVGKPMSPTDETTVQDPNSMDAGPDASSDCLFALSGTFVGYGDYGDVFPKTLSGNSPTHRESFDKVGGVFLAARERPYVYGQGNKEIDKAVDFGFEGIVVPAGMSLEIRSGENQEVIYSGKGPLVAIEGSSVGTGVGTPTNYQYKFDSGKLSHWPQWMTSYLSSTGGKVETIKIRSARWVKVSPIAGETCGPMN
ncbi:MAG: hypothetical protein ACO3A4_07965 [Silvanigrellaceae bacterium]